MPAIQRWFYGNLLKQKNDFVTFDKSLRSAPEYLFETSSDYRSLYLS